MKVWLLTSGSYSEFRVHAVFADHGLARRTADRDPQFDLLEYQVIDDVVVPRILYGASASKQQGWVINTWQTLIWPWDDYGAQWERQRKRAEITVNTNGLWVMGHGFDEQAVIKGVADQVTRIRAREEGID